MQSAKYIEQSEAIRAARQRALLLVFKDGSTEIMTNKEYALFCVENKKKNEFVKCVTLEKKRGLVECKIYGKIHTCANKTFWKKSSDGKSPHYTSLLKNETKFNTLLDSLPLDQLEQAFNQPENNVVDLTNEPTVNKPNPTPAPQNNIILASFPLSQTCMTHINGISFFSLASQTSYSLPAPQGVNDNEPLILPSPLPLKRTAETPTNPNSTKKSKTN